MKMQNHLEICKIKGDRKNTMDVTTNWLCEMKKVTLQDKTGEDTPNGRKTEGECAKKAVLLYVQSWLTRDVVDSSMIRGGRSLITVSTRNRIYKGRWSYCSSREDVRSIV